MLDIFYGRLAAWSLLTFAVPAAADPNNPISGLFHWQFSNKTLSESLPTCTQLGIIVESEDITTNATIGVPPYYMISYAVGSTPVTQFIGDDQNNLQWSIIQPVGSQLLLSVVDSQGNPGGSPPDLITVIPGQTTQCVSTPLNTPEFTVTSNVTGDLNTCSPWGITISGGSPPYVVTIVETAEPVVTNVTVPFGNNRFTYINRAVPGGKVIAGVSDLTGRWASGTPLVSPVGSTDTDCTGLTSSSGDATVIDAEDEGSATLAKDATIAHLREIVTATTAIIGILVLGIGFSLVVLLLKKHRQRKLEATLPTQFSAVSEQTSGGVGWVSVFRNKSEERPGVEASPSRGYAPTGKKTGARSPENPFITEQEGQLTSNRLTQGSEASSVGSPPSYVSNV